MDAHVFRLLANELESFLHGGRVEKIHSPAAGLLTLTVYKAGRKLTLVLRHNKTYNHGLERVVALRREKTPPALYLTRQKLPNPEKPSTLVMTLRKHLAGRVLGSGRPDWVNRRIFFFVPTARKGSPDPGSPLWLCLDLISGPSLHHELPDIEEAQWPEFELLSPDPGEAAQSLQSPAVWRAFPVLTPALRKTLSRLEPLEAASLLADLQYDAEKGGGELYLYNFAGAPSLLSAWPLTPAQSADLEEAGPTEEADTPYPKLELARRVYEPQVLAWLGADTRKEQSSSLAAEERRLNKALVKLEQEEARLTELIALRQKGVLLQAVLWRLDGSDKIERLAIAAEESPDGQAHELDLDPTRSLGDNMAYFFKQSERGRRGLGFVEQRRRELRGELERVREGFAPAPRSTRRSGREQPEAARRPGRKGADAKVGDPYKLVQRFVSSDGFTILRGKSALGNQALLKLAQPHDIWLHVQGGPSAHVVIRRDHLGLEIPERTLIEAGTLSAVKSWRKNDDRAEIISALVKDVRPVKGGAPGAVLVDKLQRAFMVSLEPDLEAKLTSTF